MMFTCWCNDYDCTTAPDVGGKAAPAASVCVSRPPSITSRPKSWAQVALQRRLSSWAELLQLNIVCVTWNVAGKMPQQPQHFAQLAQLVQLHDTSIVALAFQEAVDLKASTLGIHSITPETQSGIDAFLQVRTPLPVLLARDSRCCAGRWARHVLLRQRPAIRRRRTRCDRAVVCHPVVLGAGHSRRTVRYHERRGQQGRCHVQPHSPRHQRRLRRSPLSR
jgi:hypothetical protein